MDIIQNYLSHGVKLMSNGKNIKQSDL